MTERAGESVGERAVALGAAGMLGRAMSGTLRRHGLLVRGADVGEIDITSEASVRAGVPEGVRYVVNCAAYTDVDGAETNEALAHAVNAVGPGFLAARCREIGATLLHFSTDYVFDGGSDRPYRIDEPRRPVSAYGRTKAEGEEMIEASGCDHLIVRTSWLYAPWGKNFVRTIAKLASERPELRVVDDQRGRPTSAEGLAETAAALMFGGHRGVRHATDGGECTWFGFASAIVREVGAPCRVSPCTTAEFPRPAKRPVYSVLDLSRTEAALGPMKPWETALHGVIGRLENP